MSLPLPPRLVDRLEQEMRDPTKLSERELDVLSLVAQGYLSPEISKVLHISPWTVRSHQKRLRAKLGARTLAQAVAVAIRNGELEPS